MNSMLNINVWLIVGVSFLGTLIGTGLLRSYVLHRQILDFPNRRSSHIVPTPRGGGLAFVAVFLFAGLGLFYSGQQLGLAELATLLGGGAAIAIAGWIDDHRSLTAMTRLTVHLGVVSLCLWHLGVPEITLGSVTLTSAWVVYPVLAVLLTWCINFFNFMDGIDGIAAVQTLTMLVAAGVILCLSSDAAVTHLKLLPYFILLAVVVLGFLVWNFPPAKIFMGDTASGFLGFALGLFAVITMLDGSMNIWSWLILFGVFISDATVTLLVRWWRREPWYDAHRQHAYQRFAMNVQTAEGVMLAPERARAYAHRTVILAVAAVNWCWLLPWAIIADYWHTWGIVAAAVALVPLAGVILQVQNLGGLKGDRW